MRFIRKLYRLSAALSLNKYDPIKGSCLFSKEFAKVFPSIFTCSFSFLKIQPEFCSIAIPIGGHLFSSISERIGKYPLFYCSNTFPSNINTSKTTSFFSLDDS